MLLVEKVLEFLAPHECLSCQKEGSLLCELCALDAYDIVPDRCYRCQAISRDSAVCAKCRKSSPLKYVWVATQYDGIPKQLVKLLKFERAKGAATPIAEYMADTLPYLDTKTVITHLPTASSRQRGRGYDQAQLMAKIIAKQKGVRYVPLLARLGQSRQVGATRKQRFDQAATMFAPINSQKLNGAHVLIVDDILTTGASLEAAARILKQNGAVQVNAAVFAQKH